MKKRLLLVVLAGFALGGSLFANEGGSSVAPATSPAKGGFVSAEGLNRYPVAKVRGLPDGAGVRVEGVLIERLNGDKYLLKEAKLVLGESGRIVPGEDIVVVQISDDKWQGQTVTPTDMVRIEGKVNRLRGEAEIDATRLEKVDVLAALKRHEEDRAARLALQAAQEGEEQRARPRRLRLSAGQPSAQPVTCPACGHSFTPAP